MPSLKLLPVTFLYESTTVVNIPMSCFTRLCARYRRRAAGIDRSTRLLLFRAAATQCVCAASSRDLRGVYNLVTRSD